MNETQWNVVTNSTLFQGISKVQLQILLGCLDSYVKIFKEDESIYVAGDTVSHIGMVLEGHVRVERYDYFGNRHIVTSLSKGEVFAESYALLPKKIIQVDVIGEENATVLFMKPDEILHVCHKGCAFHTRLIENLATMMARHNLSLQAKVTYITQPTLKEKILAYLYDQKKHQQKDIIEIPFDRQQLADYLHADRTALSATLSKLKKEGILDYHKNVFKLK